MLLTAFSVRVVDKFSVRVVDTFSVRVVDARTSKTAHTPDGITW